jgi:hypothetical protein
MRATYDALGADPLGAGAILRNITHDAYQGKSRIPPSKGLVITEHLIYSYGQQPQESSSTSDTKMAHRSQVSLFRRLVVLAAAFGAAGLLWLFATKPVILHTHIIATADEQQCGEYNEAATGITVLSPFRSRAPERHADSFLRAASMGQCTADMNEKFCEFVRTRRFPAADWRLVNRWEWDGERRMRLFYKLKGNSAAFAEHGGCAIAHVDLRRTGADWKAVGYGVEYGPYIGR